jgi:hypothetical protein
VEGIHAAVGDTPKTCDDAPNLQNAADGAGGGACSGHCLDPGLLTACPDDLFGHGLQFGSPPGKNGSRPECSGAPRSCEKPSDAFIAVEMEVGLITPRSAKASMVGSGSAVRLAG